MKKLLFFLLLITLALPQQALAHEAYVLTRDQFQQGLLQATRDPLAPLLNPSMIGIFLCIGAVVALAYIFSFFLAAMPFTQIFDKVIRKAKAIGPLTIRIAISASFFYAAMFNSMLGPELSLIIVPFGQLIRFILFALSLMVFFGFFTELAALIGLLLFFSAATIFGWYMVTYANYFGELLVLLFFGSRFFSIDLFLFGKHAWNKTLEKLRNLEIPIVRILYGITLIYAGWTIKFAHQNLSISVYNQYHLINFFHAPAAFIAAGAGLAEICIGVFIVLGFGQRLTILISLIFITLSLLYFREMLWPHLMLYGISFSLFINSSDQFTLDRYIVKFLQKKLWKKRK